MTTHAPAGDTALKARHRTIWAMGDYPAIASRLVHELGPELVRACEIGPGDRVLDVAAGTGNASIPAALAGASVVACDLTPELLEAGRRLAPDGADLEWREGDAEALPFADKEFDVVMSCIGVMFAPHHQAGADEIVRVARPGGRIGLASWTPEGFIGQLFARLKPYAAPPPPGASPPPLWGQETHVRELFGDRVRDLVARQETARIEEFAQPQDFRDYFKTCYGPVMAVYAGLADEPDREAALDASLDELAASAMDGAGAMSWEYLLVTARRAGG